MKYSEVRGRIKSGDLIAFSHGDFSSWKEFKTLMVRVFTRSTYSHVAVAHVIAGRVCIFENVVPYTRLYPLSLSGDFYHLPMNAPWKPQTEQFAWDHLGVAYSQVKAMLAFSRPLAKGDLSECAAYAREILLTDGIDLGLLSRPDAVVQAALDRGVAMTFVENGGNK